jgi:large subunit ribosomal protein L33
MVVATDRLEALVVTTIRRGRPLCPTNGNDFHYQFVAEAMSHSTLRPVIKLRSAAGTGFTYVTRKSRRNDPDRLVIRKYDPVVGRHVEFREER